MKTIIIFYDSSDLELAQKIGDEVRCAGFSSWLADDDGRRNWASEVEKIIQSEMCVGAVVLWTPKSRLNPTVSDESKEVLKFGKLLLSLLIDGISEAPLGLRDGPRLHFNTNQKSSSMCQLNLKIKNIFGEASSSERALTLGEKSLRAPNMVLSVSSFETQIEPQASLELLKLAQPPAVLISAYDILRPKKHTSPSGRTTCKPKISDYTAINEIRAEGSVVLLDSGNYEAMRNQDNEWKKSKKRLLEVQDLIDVDLAFTHDNFPIQTTIKKANSQERVDTISKEYNRDQGLMNCPVAPIIHAPRLSGNKYLYDLLPEICCGVVNAVKPQMIAVAERELGDGIMERVRTVARIRKALSDQGSSTFLHILGTGNPITMAFLSMAGADFFDGLEWCRTAIDGKRWRLYHFQQWDMFAGQTGFINSPIIAQLVNNNSGAVPWITKVALHNIAFFMQASESIMDNHNQNTYENLFGLGLDLENDYQTAMRLIKDNR